MATKKKTTVKKARRRYSLTFKTAAERNKAAARLGHLGGQATARKKKARKRAK